MTREEIDAYLAEHTDETYAAFQRRLLPTLAPEKIRGVRTPALRAVAKRIAAEGGREEYLSALPHGSFEENQVHAFLIDTYRDYDDALTALTAFLPYVDNWATCDQMTLPALGRDLPDSKRTRRIFSTTRARMPCGSGSGCISAIFSTVLSGRRSPPASQKSTEKNTMSA